MANIGLVIVANVVLVKTKASAIIDILVNLAAKAVKSLTEGGKGDSTGSAIGARAGSESAGCGCE